MIGVLQYLAVVVIMMWMFWRIFLKAGRSPWWSHVVAIAFIGLFTPLPIGMGLLLGVPVVMIWVFAFAPWPSIDNPRELTEGPGYEPPSPERFRGRFRRTTRPSPQDGRRSRGITRRPKRRRDDE